MSQYQVRKAVNGIFIVVLTCLITACASSKVHVEEEKKAHKTAKINAQLGIAYLEKHNVQRAKQKLLLALDQAPTIPETWYSMAYFFEATGNTKLANTYYLKAIAVAPTRGDSQNNYGTFLCRTGDYAGAIKHFMQAVNDKDYLDPADAYENAGLCELRVPNKKLAMEYFDHAIMEDPRRSVSLIKLAQLEYESGQYSAANSHLDQYARIAAPTEQTRELSAKLRVKLGDKASNQPRLSLAEEQTQLDDAATELISQTGEIS